MGWQSRHCSRAGASAALCISRSVPACDAQGLILPGTACPLWALPTAAAQPWCPGTCAGQGSASPRGVPAGLPLPSLNVTLGACQREKRFAADKRSGCQLWSAARS